MIVYELEDKVRLIEDVTVLGTKYTKGMEGVITREGVLAVIVAFSKHDSIALKASSIELIK